MIAKRIIPLFLLKGERLVKGTNFEDFTDVGNPISQAMIYDAQGADEIIIVDIEASKQGRIMDERIIEAMIYKCRLPIGVGGGIKTIKDAHIYFKAGADKIVVNTHAVLRPSLIKELAIEFGSQSVVVSLDVKKNSLGDYDVYVYSGKEKTKVDFTSLLKEIVNNGAGELIITSIDKEGTLSGFDCGLYTSVRNFVSIPLIASGGSGCYDDMVRLFKETDSDACALGKMLPLRDYDMVRIKAYLKGKGVWVREA